jgi:hypothetical protein
MSLIEEATLTCHSSSNALKNIDILPLKGKAIGREMQNGATSDRLRRDLQLGRDGRLSHERMTPTLSRR